LSYLKLGLGPQLNIWLHSRLSN